SRRWPGSRSPPTGVRPRPRRSSIRSRSVSCSSWSPSRAPGTTSTTRTSSRMSTSWGWSRRLRRSRRCGCPCFAGSRTAMLPVPIRGRSPEPPRAAVRSTERRRLQAPARGGIGMKRVVSLFCVMVLGLLVTTASAGHADTLGANRYQVTNLVSDVPGAAAHQDPNLVNAWGLTAGPSTPWWVADNGTDRSTLYDGTGAAIPLVVKVPGAPTGAVFNGGSGFVVSHEGFSGPSLFLFATEFGTIRGWNPGVPEPAPSTKAFNVVNRHGAGAVYKGLAIATGTEGDLLYATDFVNGRVDVFNSAFNRVHKKDFVDPNLPSGYGPFGIQAINGTIFVTYAK